MRSSFRLLLCFVLIPLLVGGWLVSPVLVSAHSRLLQSSPAPGSVVDSSPGEIDFSFSESVSLDFSTLTLYDRARKEQPVGPLTHRGGDGTQVYATVGQALPPGVYTVVWRVVSATDGHLTAGSFAFRIRDAAAGGTPEPDSAIVPVIGSSDTPFSGSSENVDPIRWLVRAIMLAAAALLVGGAIFTVGVLEPTAMEGGSNGAKLWRVLCTRFPVIAAGAAALLVLALIVDLIGQVADVGTTNYLGALGRGDIAWTLLTTTRFGLAWTLKLLSAVVLMSLMLFAWAARIGTNLKHGTVIWEVMVAAGSLLLLAESLSSHAAAIDTAHEGNFLRGLPLPILSDWLHLVTACTWVGGLLYMVATLFPAFRLAGFSHEECRAFLGRAVPRFSRLAVLSVVLLTATGIYNVAAQSTDLGAIVGSSYGQVLIIKHILLLALIGLGAVNLRKLSPQLSGRVKALARARHTVPAVTTGAAASPLSTIVASAAIPAAAPAVATGADVRAVTAASERAGAEFAPVAMLRRNVRIETVLTCIVLLCAGGLTLLPPPSDSTGIYAAGAPQSSATVITSAVQPTALPTPQPATALSKVAGYSFSLTARPSSDGDQLTLVVTRDVQSSPPLTDVAKVLFKVTPQDVDAGTTAYTATLSSPVAADRLVYTDTEQLLSLDGTYLITTILERARSDDLEAGFRLDLAEASGLTAAPAEVVDAQLQTLPSPPISGTATLLIKLLDGAHKPIDGAKLSVDPLMPAHGHVEPTGVASPVAGQPGTYSMPVHFSMGGAWLIILSVDRPGLPTVKTDASLDVIDPNATPEPGGVP